VEAKTTRFLGPSAVVQTSSDSQNSARAYHNASCRQSHHPIKVAISKTLHRQHREKATIENKTTSLTTHFQSASSSSTADTLNI